VTDRPTLRARSVLGLLAAAVAGGAIVWAVLAGAHNSPAPVSSPAGARTPAAVAGTPAEIERVVDGDTVVVLLDGRRERVRLLNIDTPETVAEDRPVECLGPEASEFTKHLLPPGTEVTLAFDIERRDQYGRMLAAVYTADGENVNVKIAREGLAYAVTFGENDRFRPLVQAAMEEARDAHRGLFDPTGPCAGR
jgi:micrococcal nuclease